MDMLRWILLLLGVLVVAGLYGYYRWQEKGPVRGGRRSSRRRRRRSDPDVDSALKDLDDLVIDDPDADPVDLDLDVPVDEPRAAAAGSEDLDDPDQTVSRARVRYTRPQPESGPDEAGSAGAEQDRTPVRGEPEPETEPAPGPAQREFPGFGADEPRIQDEEYQDAGEKIVVLHVVAGRGYCFTGPALVEAAEQVGLRHGRHEIFHRTMNTRNGEVAVFSMASMVKPGTFDLSRVDEMETPGVALFMRLPAPFDGLTAFEQMLETARRLADSLDGYLLDPQRCDLTQQAVEHIREELREYRRLAHLAARKGRA
ncbi:MAG: cell division protein ZipA [Ectothiorhodospiraceae bacterium]|nr:cell division protein ZipA [Ectothiorhodospiraceae bacterium]